MKFLMPDGVEVVGSSYTDIVSAMNEQKMTPSRHLSTYRKAMAQRIRDIYRVEVDDSSDKNLILSMEQVGIVTRL